MRIVAWNIRAGGGVRVPRISRHLARWAPDAVVLSEFRATPPSLELARALAAFGLVHQCTSASPRNPSANALLVAARWPLRRLRLARCLSPPARRSTRLYLVLAERPERLPDRPGLRQRRAARASTRRRVRVGRLAPRAKRGAERSRRVARGFP